MTATMRTDTETAYQTLLAEITGMLAVPRGLDPTARHRALIALEERHRALAHLVDRVTYAGLPPEDAAEELRAVRWRSPMPTGPKLTDEH